MRQKIPQDTNSAIDKTRDASQFIKRQQVHTKHEASDEDFNFIREIVYKLSRISIGPNKRVMVLSRISRRMRALQINTVKDYCEYIKKPTGSKELSALIDAISTNHTYFFREAQHFAYLESAILQNRIQQTIKPFKVWSAAGRVGASCKKVGFRGD